MTKYIFENTEGLTFIQCGHEEKIKIIIAKIARQCQVLVPITRTWHEDRAREVSFDAVYRILVPVPCEIDWPQVPPQFKYLFVNHDGKGAISEKIPVERRDTPALAHSRYGDSVSIYISEGDYGFKRGSVCSIDSLVVRPIGV